MKIAVACMNEHTVSAHFGRADKYIIYEIENGEVMGRNTVRKFGHDDFFGRQPGGGQGHGHGEDSGFGHHAGCKHEQMIENIRDCDVVLAGGMGRGIYMGVQRWGIRPIVTDITEVEKAVRAVLDGTIVDHTERLH